MKKKYYIAKAHSVNKEYVFFARNIGDAHKKARELFGYGVSFSVSEMNLEQTMRLDPAKVIVLP